MSENTLYTKYRPSTWDDVIQPDVVNSLKAQVIDDNIASSYLFSGFPGTGKTTLARILGAALLCSNRKDGECNPCGYCKNCISVREDKNKDYIEIDCGKNGGVDTVREIDSNLRFAPMDNKKRIYVFDECQQLTSAAQSALLKITEDAYDYVVFLFLTSEPHQVKKALKTRSQHFNMSLIPDEDLIRLLKDVCKKENFDYDDEAIHYIVQSSQGSARSALSLLEQVSAIGVTLDNTLIVLKKAPRQICFNLAKSILEKQTGTAYNIINAAHKEGRDLSAILVDTAGVFMELLENMIIPDSINNADILSLNNKVSPSHLLDINIILLETVSKIRATIPVELSVKLGVLTAIRKYSTLTKPKI